jgi:BirA family transcriptional regulator, biotin operon repressor / biotin---[acetyl-CoA-carboxylase] ligase
MMHLQTTTAEPPAINLTAIEAAIAATPFANHLHHLASTSSTNDLALQAALTGARTGVWIADHQLAGRGRGRHTWHSPAGSGLYMTALAAPPIPMQSAPSLSLRVAIAVQSAITSTYGFRAPAQIDIRWPNDLLLNRKKVGGILIDTASNPATPTAPATLRYAIIGIGINLNHTAFPPELEPIATSIRRELPAAVLREPFTRSVENSTKCLPREPLAGAILLALAAELRALTSNHVPRTSDLSTHSTWITNKRVRVEPRDGVPGYTGTTAGLNPAGFLLVTGDDGQIHTVLSGGLREP